MLDELNRLKLMRRYEQHMAGVKMGKLMLIDNAKPYTYRPLKNKAVPMPDQGLTWVPRLANPLVNLNPPVVKLTVYGIFA
jgi:hypothetical protein